MRENAFGENKEYCTPEENAYFLKNANNLPDGVFQYMGVNGNVPTKRFYRILDTSMTDEEFKELMIHRQARSLQEQTELLKNISSKVNFFFVAAIIGLCIAGISFLITLTTCASAALSPW